jgi:ADP-dependent NAD(P)H-hydrate dehydratase / NAD(P)H-hydrate epimerase
MRSRGAVVVALDIVSGVDATTGEAYGSTVNADLTLTFGTIKRAHLIDRDTFGTIVVLDIGLGAHAEIDDGAPSLVDEAWVGENVPRIAATAHKGSRKKLAIIGGARGMAGAAVLAARAALRSGIGMVKLVVDDESFPIVQETEPAALATTWPSDDGAVERDISSWADAVIIGPGLGRGDRSRELLERLLRKWMGPTLLDADAITLFENRANELATLLGGRASLLTPHPAEFARLSGRTVDEVLTNRFDAGAEMARQLNATVLLKGTPTVVSDAKGRKLVSAAGTPALATAGSGDVLSGVCGTLLAQLDDPLVAGAAGAWVHGRAAERAPARNDSGARGIALDDVIAELRDAWTFDRRPSRYPVLAELSLHAGR